MDSIELLKILEALEEQKKILNRLLDKAEPSRDEEYRSFEINELATSLAKASLSYESIGVNRKGVDGDYPDLPYILTKVQKALAEQGLSIYPRTQKINGETFLITELLHSSGQWISTSIQLILTGTDKDNNRTIAIHKRNQVMTLLNIYPGEKDMDDDDGDEQSEKNYIASIKSHNLPNKKRSKEVITKEQYDQVLYVLQDYPQLAEQLKEKYTITSLKDLPKETFIEELEKLRHIKEQLKSAK